MQDLTVRDRAAYLDAAATLVVADLHVGRDEASSVAFPLGERADLRERIDALVAHFDPEAVVFAGDVIHTFDGVSDAAERSLSAIVDTCEAAGAEPVLVAGNHDTALRAAWDGPVHEEYRLDGGPETVVCHGHEEPTTDADRYVIGHDHPTLTVEGVRHPCFLYGPDAYRGADVLMLPAFNRLAPGVVVNEARASDLTSPLVDDLDRFHPLVWDADAQETLRFPPLGDFREML